MNYSQVPIGGLETKSEAVKYSPGLIYFFKNEANVIMRCNGNMAVNSLYAKKYKKYNSQEILRD